jgi:prophage regulatory protein
MTLRILRIKDLVERTGLSVSTIYDRMDPSSPRHAPDFPKPFPLGGKAVGWSEEDVEAWLRNCKDVPERAAAKGKANSDQPAKKSAPTPKQVVRAPSMKKKPKGSLAEMIMDGGDINARLLDYLHMPEWTPAMGALIVSGVAPEANCTEIPSEGIGLDGLPIQAASDRLVQARRFLTDWSYWAEDETDLASQVTPAQFLHWCQESRVETDWLHLCLELCGQQDESKAALVGARFAMLTSKTSGQ